MKFQPKRLTGYSESDLIQEIRRVVQECGGVIPSRKEFARIARIHPTTITIKFGSYPQAVRKAGFDYTEKYTAEQVKANLSEVLKRANGYCFSQDFFQKNGGVYSVKTVKSILGVKNWEAALELVGAKKRIRAGQIQVIIRPQRHKKPSGQKKRDLMKEILLDELRKASAKAPKVSLTYRVYKTNGGTYSRRPFKIHFGSWTKAVNAIGNLSGRQQKYSKDELFDEIQRLWEHFGRQPTYQEMDDHGKISGYCYATRFRSEGKPSWTNAIHAFCEDRNSEAALAPLPFSESLSSVQVPKEPEKKEFAVAIPSTEPDTLIIIHKTSRQVPKRLRWRVFARDNFICQDCGRSPAKHGIALEADHKTAWTNGGETVFENLRTLCEDCNKGKSNL